MNLLALKYNNHFNRIVKFLGSLEEYQEAGESVLLTSNNFNANDGVTASVVLLLPAGFEPDYLVAIDESGAISSRWFIVETVFLSGYSAKQYKLFLRRDLLADYYYETLDALCMIERGPVSASSPLAYKDEGFSFNQIKKSETLLKDSTGTPWIVGYVSRDTDYTGAIVTSPDTELVYPELGDLGLTLADPADPSAGATAKALTSSTAVCVYKLTDQPAYDGPLAPMGRQYNFEVNLESSSIRYDWYTESHDDTTATTPDGVSNVNEFALEQARVYALAVEFNASDIKSAACDAYGLISQSDLDRLLALDGKIVKDTPNGKYYTLRVQAKTTSTFYKAQVKSSVAEETRLFMRLQSTIENFIQLTTDPCTLVLSDFRYFTREETTVTVTLTDTSVAGQIRTALPTTRNRLDDAPYDMFAMPFTLENLSLAQAMITTSPGANTKKIYDVQILPYCPYPEAAPQNAGTVDIDYSAIEESDGLGGWITIGKLLWCRTSSRTIYINNPVEMDAPGIANATPAEKIKLATNLSKWRLVSPNWNGAYEFNAAKNGGVVSSFRVDFTYRPVSPFIHVAPTFAGLYGTVNDDARGLICGGDFSIDVISDAWTEYQVQNKNFQNIFDVRIKTLDAEHKLDRIGNVLGMLGSAGATGIGAGLLTGNAAVGLGAGAASLAGGIADIAIGEEKFSLERKAAIESFNLQLGNIKALPDTLTKISSYNVINKYFPIVEYYTSTDEEADLFLDYLKAFNYSIGAVMKISDALRSGTNSLEYVKGKIIRISIDGDSHVSEEIYKLIDGGVYYAR